MNVQERLQLKRIPLDKWSIREQLCLAMAVLCSGDQNWMSVSRALKMMCGNSRPTDWFSQKFCAAQYGKLLENVETPKRKKRTATERDNPTADVTIIPGELIVRKLVHERTAELKKIVEEEQREYQQLAQDIRLLQSDALDDAQVLAMWEQIENDNREKEKEQQKHAQWLKEREEKKIEMERAWRPGAVVAASMSPTSNSNSSGSPSRNSPSLFLKATGGAAAAGQLTPKVEPNDQHGDGSEAPLKQGTSPLLTSLLKSPSSTPSTPTPGSSAVGNSSMNPRNLAPTITNLLTGGQQAQGQQQQQVVVVATNPIAPGYNLAGTQNVPNSGSSFFNFPSKHPQHQQGAIVTTPSKAAPTLSKLLDPNRSKGAGAGHVAGGGDEDAINMDDDQQLMDVFKELMPDDLADILTDNNEMIVSPELLDGQDLDNVQELIQPGGGQHQQQQQGPQIHGQAVAGTSGLGNFSQVEVKKEQINVEEMREEKMAEAVAASKNDGGGEEGQMVEQLQKDRDGEEQQQDKEPLSEEENKEINPSSGEIQFHGGVYPVEQVNNYDRKEEDQPKDSNATTEEIEDNLEEQLSAITNGEGEVKDQGNQSVEELKTEDPQIVNAEETTEVVTESQEKKSPEEAAQLAASVDDSQEPPPPYEKPQEVTESEEKSLQSQIADEAEDKKTETEVDQEATEEGNKEPIESEQMTTEATEDHNSSSHRADERKVSTDNEDQFEDAKSTIGDSGNPVDDIDMNSSAAKEGNEPAPVTTLEQEQMMLQEQQEMEEKRKNSSATEQTATTPEVSDRSSRSKRDMPRRNRSHTSSASTPADEKPQQPQEKSQSSDRRSQLMEDSGEETKSSSASNISLRARLKERERSESPLVGMDDDTSSDMIIPRTRRRYSSTPVIDSVPSSPASGDDREYKNWKKTVLIAFNQFSTLHYKYSAVLVQQVPEEFRHIILRPMEMQTIKKNIETGVIRTTMEFQRDILLMVQNAIMMNTRKDRDWTNLINEMMVEVDYWKRETEKNLNGRDSEGAGGSNRDAQGKVRNRKSMRITTAS